MKLVNYSDFLFYIQTKQGIVFFNKNCGNAVAILFNKHLYIKWPTNFHLHEGVWEKIEDDFEVEKFHYSNPVVDNSSLALIFSITAINNLIEP